MNLLITGAWTSKYIDEIEEEGHKVLFMQQEKDKLPCAYDWPEGIICNGLFLYHPLSRFTNLRYIQLTSAGLDRVPMQDILKRKIEIHSARGVYSVPMAEFAVAGVLDLYKDMDRFRDQQKNHAWIKNRQVRELAGSRVLIVGCGSVGTECAKRFKAFGCRITGVDRSAIEAGNVSRIKDRNQDRIKDRNCDRIKDWNDVGNCDRTDVRIKDWNDVGNLGERFEKIYDQIRPPEALDEELPASDIVILSIPLTDETRGIIDERRLSLIKGILVNISRGALVDRRALEKWEGAAVLDVFEEEPLPPESPLWEKENMIITPHNSFVGDGNAERLKVLIMGNMRKVCNLPGLQEAGRGQIGNEE